MRAIKTLLLISSAFPMVAVAAPAESTAAAEVAAGVADAAPAVEQGDAFDQPNAIVVTARRREEALQDVPLPITVIGGATLNQTSTYNVSRVVQLLPTVQYYASNPRNSNINIRGLGAPLGLTNDGIEQGVGLYIDQVYYSRPASASFDFIDIDQIEVLRGPQGTLYGKNTTAGAINITTSAPSFSPQARFEVSGGNYDFFQAKASISGPIAGDVLAGRLAISGSRRDGTIYNTRLGRRVNGLDNLGGKATFLYTEIDDLKLTLSADWNHQDPKNCCTQIFARVAPTLRSSSRQFNALIARLGYEPPSRNAFDRLTDVDELQAKQDLGGASLLAEWDVGDNSLTSVTAWRFWNWRPQNDRDFIGLPITTKSANNSNQRQLMQEFRFASSGKNTIDYVVGVFGYRQTINTDGLQQQGAAANVFTNGPTRAVPVTPPTTPPSTMNVPNLPQVLDGLTQINTIHFENNSLAAFGQATWNVTDTVRVQPGLRFNYDTKDASYVSTVSGGVATNSAELGQQRAALPAQAYFPRYRDFNVSGDINVSWKPTRDLLVYGVYARAFKSGGINLNGLPFRADNTLATELAQVRPEKVDHFELGVKSQFWDRRATLNVTAFHTKVKDYQTTVSNGQIGIVRGYLANADVRLQGIEAEFSLRPIDHFSAYVNFAYNDAEYTDFPDAPIPIECTGITTASVNLPATCVANGTRFDGTPGNTVLDGFKDISGERFPGVSKYAVSWGAEASLPIGGNERELYAGTDASYRSSFSSGATPSPYTDVHGYALVNFRVGYRDGNDWNVFGWMRNAFDRNYFEFLTVQPGNNGLIVGQVGDPRTYGITVGKRF